MSNENSPTEPEVVQLTAEETEQVAQELGHSIIITTTRFCRYMGLSMADESTRILIRSTLKALEVALGKAVPNTDDVPTPTTKA